MRQVSFFGMILMAVVAWGAEVAVPAPGGILRHNVDPMGKQRAVVTFNVPIVDIQEIWTPQLSAPDQQRKWNVGMSSAPQSDMPYVAFVNMAGQNVFSFGARTLEYDSRISARMNQERGLFEVSFEVAAGKNRKLPVFEITLDRRKLPWTGVLREWRERLAYPRGFYPEASWRPVYCSWYAVHAAVTQDWAERTGALAARLGFGTFILDDGWSYDEAKRVNPQTLPSWYRDVGQWNAFSKAKFPDFSAHRERMRGLGLNYMVWTAPLFVGERTDAFRRFGFDKRPDKRPRDGIAFVDLDNPEQLADVRKQLLSLLETARLDGLKIDFLDSVGPSVDNPHGMDMLDFIRDLTGELRAARPNLMIEFRQNYANPLLAAMATQFRAGDVPFEWLDNLRRILQIRLLMGDGIPVHADPICWADGETSSNIDRHFMAAMAGVPMVSVDLERLSDDEKTQIRHWLTFYSRHVERFQRNGKWDVVYKNSGVAYAVSELPREILVIVNDPDVVSCLNQRIGDRKAVILNLTYERLDFSSGLTVEPASSFPSKVEWK